MRKSVFISAAFVAVLGIFSAPATAVVTLWNEAVDGDITGDRLDPLTFTLANNDAYSVMATSSQGDREYVSFVVPSGKWMSEVHLISYTGVDGIAFIGLQAGPTFTEPPTGTNVANLLGYTHFGSGVGNVGMNVLPSIGTGAGAQGFTGPLPSDTYTFWIQQTSSVNPSTYQFDFIIVPEPSASMLLLTSAFILRRRNRV